MNAPQDTPLKEAQEQPQNGVAGLKHWRQDLLAGVVVSLVSLPLSSGIAIASGAPPIYGIISSIIAGLVYPFLGGSYVTISGPAAGLAPALVAIMVTLGGVGDAHTVGAGYHKLLVVIFLVGVFQIIIARLELAKFAAVFPASVVEGMLSAIGILILVKAIPLMFGVLDSGHPHGFVDYVAHVPSWIGSGARPAILIGVATLAIMLATASERARAYKVFRVVPPHMWGVSVAIAMGFMLDIGAIDPRLLVQVPENPFSGLHLPAFMDVFADPSIWGAAGIGVLTLLLIDGVESLATAQAIDREDPYRRTSDPDRVLLAMGVSNLLSSLAGGLTVIPGGVKSKTNIEAGGRTLWSNFANATMLLIFLFIAPGLIAMIPGAALGGILVYTGLKMAHPAIARHISKVGTEQVVLYALTVVATLLTDLLIGVGIGTLCKLGLLAYYARKEAELSGGKLTTSRILRGMFRDPIRESASSEGVMTLRIEDSLVCFNAFRLREHLAGLGANIERVVIDVSQAAVICDHTACDLLLSSSALVGERTLEIQGLDEMTSLGTDKASIHLQAAPRHCDALR